MIRWITEWLGTAAWDQIDASNGIRRVDVRELVDKAGNPSESVASKIEEAVGFLRRGERVVIACDYGISRSNAIAAGTLARLENISLDDAIRRVIAATGEDSIKLEVLAKVRHALLSNDAPLRIHGEKRVAVTGATGNVGRTLLRRSGFLAVEHQELDLERDVVPLHLWLKQFNVGTLVHLAHPRTYTNNSALGSALVMLKNVLDACRENRTHLIYLSCWEVYSGHVGELIADESVERNARGTIGLSKSFAEEMIEHYHRCDGISYTILRASAVYGSDCDRPRFLRNFVTRALRNEEIVTHRYSNGLPALDLLHVDDLSRAIEVTVERKPQGAFNIGTGMLQRTLDIAHRIVAYVNSPSTIRQMEIKEAVSNIALNSNGAALVLGWKAQIQFAEGLNSLIETWIRGTEAGTAREASS